ncbi:MAG: hypothetical protein JXA42_17115 [Anaerolineales bacterium]|nr:hypothetical protein [Anaerolineales bacterium]
MGNSLTLDSLQDYIFCPMRYWWRKVAHLEEPDTLDQVAHAVLHEALLEYALIYWMEAKPEPAVVQQVIQDCPETHHFQIMVATLWGYKFIEWEQADLGRLLRQYSRADAEIVLNFVRGGEEYRRPDGSPYQAPRLTKVYEKLAREAGLPEMKQQIDEAADKLSIKLRKGQSLADTYAQANGEIVADLVANLPDWKGKVLKINVPFKTQSADLELSGHADLLVQVERQPELVFFQYGHRFLPFKAYKNDLRIITALLSAGEGWKQGQMNSIRIFNLLGEVRQERIYGPGRRERLEAVIELARHSIKAGSYLPRFLHFETYQTCLACPYQRYCIEGGGDILERMDPTGHVIFSQQNGRKARVPQ